MEFEILYAIQNLRCEFLDIFMKYISFVGNLGMIWIAAGIFMLFFKNYRKCGIAVLIALIFCLILGNALIKNLVARSRPCWIDKSINMIISVPRDYSFPSGHTVAAFAVAPVVLFYHKKWGIVAYVLAFLMAFSRLYLFVHFPTDILGGVVLGSFNAFLGILITNKIYKKQIA